MVVAENPWWLLAKEMADAGEDGWAGWRVLAERVDATAAAGGERRNNGRAEE